METVVLILAHNEAEHIAKTIASVKGQENVEILFVDDASTDDTVEIATEALTNSGVKFQFVQNPENLGVPESARRAFSTLSGRNCFILRLDGDDELLPDAVKNLKAEYKPGSFVAGPYLEKEPSGEIRTDGCRNPMTIYECLACGVLMRTNDVKLVGGLARTDVGAFIEYDLYARLIQINIYPRIIDEAVYLYNRHEDSITSQKAVIKESLNKLALVWGQQLVSQIRGY